MGILSSTLKYLCINKANEVLPTLGLEAIIIKFPGKNPPVKLSKNGIPVGIPTTLLFASYL